MLVCKVEAIVRTKKPVLIVRKTNPNARFVLDAQLKRKIKESEAWSWLLGNISSEVSREVNASETQKTRDLKVERKIVRVSRVRLIESKLDTMKQRGTAGVRETERERDFYDANFYGEKFE